MLYFQMISFQIIQTSVLAHQVSRMRRPTSIQEVVGSILGSGHTPFLDMMSRNNPF